MVRTGMLVLAGAVAALALAPLASAEETQPTPPAPAVAARAHLVYRAGPQARPIEGEATVLQPAVQPARADAASRPTPQTAPQAQVLILALQQR